MMPHTGKAQVINNLNEPNPTAKCCKIKLDKRRRLYIHIPETGTGILNGSAFGIEVEAFPQRTRCDTLERGRSQSERETERENWDNPKTERN